MSLLFCIRLQWISGCVYLSILWLSPDIIVQLPSFVQLFATAWTAACQASLFLTISQSLPRFMPIAFVMASSHLILWYHLLLFPQYFPASGTFPMSQLLASSDQNTGASTSASVLPMSIQDWFPLRLIGLISLLSKGLSGVFSSTTVGRHQFFWHSAFFTVQLSQPLCDHWEDQSLDYTDLCRYWCLCFSTHCLGLSKLSCQEATAFWLITSRSDFRAQEEEIHLFCFYLA